MGSKLAQTNSCWKVKVGFTVIGLQSGGGIINQTRLASLPLAPVRTVVSETKCVGGGGPVVWRPRLGGGDGLCLRALASISRRKLGNSYFLC